MPRHIEMEMRTALRIEGILGFMRRKVVRFGTGAAVICPKEYLGRTAFLVITEERWKGERRDRVPVKRGRKTEGGKGK